MSTLLFSTDLAAPRVERRPDSSPRARSPRAGSAARVTIQYSRPANYLSVARKLLDSLRREFQGALVETELVASSGGVYEVSVNGKLVFSKKATYRLPAEDEIFYHVRAALASRLEPTHDGTSSS